MSETWVQVLTDMREAAKAAQREREKKPENCFFCEHMASQAFAKSIWRVRRLISCRAKAFAPTSLKKFPFEPAPAHEPLLSALASPGHVPVRAAKGGLFWSTE